jgi:hypothetical protein
LTFVCGPLEASREPPTVEATLAHVTGDNEVELAYARGDLFEKRRALMAHYCGGSV